MDDTGRTSTTSLPITTPKAAKEIVEAQKIVRRGQLEAVGDYITFCVQYALGLGLAIVGAVGYFAPHAFSVPIPSPGAWVGAGITLLCRSQITKLLHKFLGAFL